MTTKKKPPQTSTTASPKIQKQTIGNLHDPVYTGYLAKMAARVKSALLSPEPVFIAGMPDGELWELYLSSFPKKSRQFHTCTACRKFIETYGALVHVLPDGKLKSIMWDLEDAPGKERSAVGVMKHRVESDRVSSVFYTDEVRWGQPITGQWRHFGIIWSARDLKKAAAVPDWYKVRSLAETPGQMMAQKRQDFATVLGYVVMVPVRHLRNVVHLLKNDEQMRRAEKVLPGAEWLLAVKDLSQLPRPLSNNLIWAKVATAPAGFCHPKAGMLGTLLDDLASGKSVEEVRRSFAEKMEPTRYQRPQAAPKEGTIAQAEKLVERMGLAAAFPRRFARLDELVTIWKDRALRPEKREEGTGLFSGIRSRGQGKKPLPVGTPARSTMTWVKFQRDILPSAVEILYRVPSTYQPFGAFATAVDPEAPCLLQWDRPDKRNPVSWYQWQMGALARQFGLLAGSTVRVEAITESPAHWYRNEAKHFPRTAWFVLEGARETRGPSMCLFPEILRSELHGVRSVIEAYSRKHTLNGLHQPHAAGLMFSDGGNRPEVLLTVRDREGFVTEIHLDRFE